MQKQNYMYTFTYTHTYIVRGKNCMSKFNIICDSDKKRGKQVNLGDTFVKMKQLIALCI